MGAYHFFKAPHQSHLLLLQVHCTKETKRPDGSLTTNLAEHKPHRQATSGAIQAHLHAAFYLLNAFQNQESPWWQQLVRGKWPDVLKAAAAIALLLKELVSAAGPGRAAKWPKKGGALELARTAVKLLGKLPGTGEYHGQKIIRIAITWWLGMLSVTFPPGDTWFDWMKMSRRQPKKSAKLAAYGFKMSSPRTFLESVRRGGHGLPPAARSALYELVDNIHDPDIGCFICDFMKLLELLAGEKALRNTETVLAVFNHILTSTDALPAYLRGTEVV
jgi:hypothetical protein